VIGGVDELAEFYAATPRQSPGLSGRSGLHGQVDEILNALQLPAEVDKDGDWKLTTDVGPFLLIVDKESYDLVVVQTIQSMERKVKNSADEMYVLLALNFSAHGIARFGAIKDGDSNLLVLTARIRSDEVTRERIETMLRDCMRLSRRVDELLGNEPAQPGSTPAAGDWKAADAALAQAEQGRGAGNGAQQPAPPAPGAQQPAPPAPQPPAASPPPASPAATPPPAAQPASPAPAATPPPQGPAPQSPAPASPPQQPAAPAPQQPQAPATPPQPASPPAQALPPANWYADPYRQARLRYWDGQRWTQHVAQ
jgi:hypothetical protein